MGFWPLALSHWHIYSSIKECSLFDEPMSQLLKANSQWQSFLYHNVYKNLFSLHIGLHVSCYSLMTIPWHEDFCKWCAEIFQILIVCDSPHCATASLTTSNAKHFPRRRESNLLFRQKHYKKRPSGKRQSFNPRLYPRMREDDGPVKVSVKRES